MEDEVFFTGFRNHNMAKYLQLGLLVITALCAGFFLAETSAKRQICSYYGSDRRPKEAYSLSNCTWYRERACCSRTEVTSTYAGMPHLDTSSDECRNHLNYMMCYYCSPDQYLWFRQGKLHICKSFCDDIYTHCKDAKYDGKAISSVYSDGNDFCKGQFFNVLDQDGDLCFKYDETLFGAASLCQVCLHVVVTLLVFSLTNYFTWT